MVQFLQHDVHVTKSSSREKIDGSSIVGFELSDDAVASEVTSLLQTTRPQELEEPVLVGSIVGEPVLVATLANATEASLFATNGSVDVEANGGTVAAVPVTLPSGPDGIAAVAVDAEAHVDVESPLSTVTPDPLGMTFNSEGDMEAFFWVFALSSLACFAILGVFCFLRKRYSIIYADNCSEGADSKTCIAPCKVPDNLLGWVRPAIFTGTRDLSKSVGLDNAMMLEFANLCMKIMCIIGIPMMCIMAPVNTIFGGQDIGADHLTILTGGFGNIQVGSRLSGVYAVVVWAVVYVVKECTFSAQNKFLSLRIEWLRDMSPKRACTVMVEGIPIEYQSDANLRQFFELNVHGSKVVMASCTKDTSDLLPLWQKREECVAERREAIARQKLAGAPGNNEDLNKQIQELALEIKKNRANIKSAVEGSCLDSGFVQFEHRYHAELAVQLDFTADREDWIVSIPPIASDIIWSDLTRDSRYAQLRELIGYGLVVGLYFAYVPAVVGITNIATIIHMGPLQPVWQGLAPIMGLTVMVSFLPTFLVLIFKHFFTLKSASWAQAKLQTWYFLFQLVFVVLATAICQNIAGFTRSVLLDPYAIVQKLATDLPLATHFYMNFLVFQCVTHVHNILRLANFAKFHAAAVLYSREEAKSMAEPEDQDYYGIGSRSARWPTIMVVGIVFGTLCPPICVLTFINFAVVRLVYGYLIPFAETKKPDLGGVFWVHMLRCLFYGCIIYTIMMTGVLWMRSACFWPAAITAPSIPWTVWSLRRFDQKFAWAKLTQVDITKVGEDCKACSKLRIDEGEYIQAELVED
jgi:hypothetical protein